MDGERRFLDYPLDLEIEEHGVVIRRDGPRSAGDSSVFTNVPHLVTHHSPDGYEFGYMGSGPTDLAFNIAEWFLRHLGWEGATRDDSHGGQTYSLLAWRLKGHVKAKWVAPISGRESVIPYAELTAFFQRQIDLAGAGDPLPWETKELGDYWFMEEKHALLDARLASGEITEMQWATEDFGK